MKPARYHINDHNSSRQMNTNSGMSYATVQKQLETFEIGELVEFLAFNGLMGTFGIWLKNRDYGHNVVYSVEDQKVHQIVYNSEIRKVK